MLSDLRLALRSLVKSPGFTTVALLTLALGIGVNTSMFSVLRTLMLRTLSYPESHQLIRVHRTGPEGQRLQHPVASFLDLRAPNSGFQQMAAVDWAGFSLTEPGQPAEWLRTMRVTADFFPMLRVPPALGRTFSPDENQAGHDQVIVLSYSFWSGRYGRDRNILGRELRLNGETVSVIGVMPERFDDHLLWGPVDAWRPLTFTDPQRSNRRDNSLSVVGRLKPGVSRAHAQVALEGLVAQLAIAYPATNAKTGVRLEALSRGSGGDDGQAILFVTALAIFVLLIACANLANLQFARTSARGREFAVRAALGASRGRLVRQILVESLLLAFVGGALGLLVAVWCNDALSARFIVDNQAGLALPLDLRSLSFSFLVSGAAGIAFGLLPAWLASRTNLSDALKRGGRGSTVARSQHRVRHTLIVVEVALALVLLASAGFFVGGLQRFIQRDPGWRVDGLLTGYVTIAPPRTATTDELRAAHRRSFAERLQERVARIPGVEQVTFGRALPTWGRYIGYSVFSIEGHLPPPPGLEPSATMPSVAPGFFDTLGLRVLQGRGFTTADRAGAPPVVVINEFMARTFWPGESPIGKRIGTLDPARRDWREIVGVVSDARASGLIAEQPLQFQMYRPWDQVPMGGGSIILRTRLPAESLATELRRAVAELDPDLPLRDISTVRHEIDLGLANLHLAGWTLASFALLGLLLAAIGIYAVIANSVELRTNEFGIRLALGAQVRDILFLVVGQGLRLTLVGALLGLAGAVAIARVLGAIMPAVPASNALTTVVTTAFLLGVAVLACWLPARRATKVDPMVALRAE